MTFISLNQLISYCLLELEEMDLNMLIILQLFVHYSSKLFVYVYSFTTVFSLFISYRNCIFNSILYEYPSETNMSSSGKPKTPLGHYLDSLISATNSNDLTHGVYRLVVEGTPQGGTAVFIIFIGAGE